MVFFICVLFFFVLWSRCHFVLFMPLLYFFYAILSTFFIFGRVVFLLTLCQWLYVQQSVLSYGYVTVACLGGIVRCLSKYLIAGVDTVSIFCLSCFVLFSGVSCFCLCYAVVINFKGKEIK